MFKWRIFENLIWQMTTGKGCIYWAWLSDFCLVPLLKCSVLMQRLHWWRPPGEHTSLQFSCLWYPFCTCTVKTARMPLCAVKVPTVISSDEVVYVKSKSVFYHSWTSPVILTGDLTHSRHSLNVDWPFPALASFFSSWSPQRAMYNLPSSLASSSTCLLLETK